MNFNQYRRQNYRKFRLNCRFFNFISLYYLANNYSCIILVNYSSKYTVFVSDAEPEYAVNVAFNL